MIHVKRLTKGMDLFKSIKNLCEENNIQAGVILSGVGCVDRAIIRDADGVTKIELNEMLEIVSLNGTVSVERCHVHVAFSKVGLNVIGGHLCEGCLVNTVCELVIMELGNYKFGKVFDENTGYNELKIEKR